MAGKNPPTIPTLVIDHCDDVSEGAQDSDVQTTSSPVIEENSIDPGKKVYGY